MVNEVSEWVAEQRFRETGGVAFRVVDPTFQKPLVLEDALGYIVEMPQNLITSWEGYSPRRGPNTSNRCSTER